MPDSSPALGFLVVFSSPLLLFSVRLICSNQDFGLFNKNGGSSAEISADLGAPAGPADLQEAAVQKSGSDFADSVLPCVLPRCSPSAHIFSDDEASCRRFCFFSGFKQSTARRRRSLSATAKSHRLPAAVPEDVVAPPFRCR